MEQPVLLQYCTACVQVHGRVKHTYNLPCTTQSRLRQTQHRLSERLARRQAAPHVMLQLRGHVARNCGQRHVRCRKRPHRWPSVQQHADQERHVQPRARDGRGGV